MSDQNEDHGLTPEEEAALNAPDEDGAKTEVFNPDADPKAPDEIDETKTSNDVAVAGAATNAVDDAATGQADESSKPADQPVAEQPDTPAAKQEVTAPAPVLVVAAPEDAKAQLDAIAAKKSDLIDKFEAGEITTREYQNQLDSLNDQRSEIQSQVREANMAQKLNEQQVQNLWVADCTAFIGKNAEYADINGERHQALNAAIMTLAKMPQNRGISNQDALAKAHKMVKAMYGEEVVAKPTAAANPAKVAQPVVPKPAAPPNIGSVPAANMNDDTGGEFAAVDRLARSGNVLALEDAIENMTEAQRARYFKS